MAINITSLLRDQTPMFSVTDEKAAAQSTNSNTALPRSVDLGDAQETKPNAFSAKPRVSLAANAL
ncbi:hypothetical protein HU719_016045 [Pseudomonas sp. SWRI107]|nr:hypothetical protein [Pseudomonas farsensis]